jgi:DNA-binding IclR family transcriptional regulator
MLGKVKGENVKKAENGERQAIQSVVVGAKLLEVLASRNGRMPLMTLAKEAGMAAAKAHRYLAGYITAGLVEQDPVSGHYDLGRLALDVGLAALRRLDVVELAHPMMIALGDETGETVSMTIWGNRGPTLVRWVPSNAPVSINVNIGSVLPLLTSSNGRIFAAYLPKDLTSSIIAAELADPNGAAWQIGIRTSLHVDALLGEVRHRQMSIGDGLVLPGICSFSCPVFGHDGALVAALTIVGIKGMMDMTFKSPVAVALARTAKALSERMGHSGR